MQVADGDDDPQSATQVSPRCWGRGEDFEGRDRTMRRRLCRPLQNIVNPMVGSPLQHTGKVGEAQAVRAVENRGDGTRTGGGSAGSEASVAVFGQQPSFAGCFGRLRVMVPRWEWTLRLHPTEGRSLETPGEAFDVARKAPLEAEMVASEEAT